MHRLLWVHTANLRIVTWEVHMRTGTGTHLPMSLIPRLSPWAIKQEICWNSSFILCLSSFDQNFFFFWNFWNFLFILHTTHSFPLHFCSSSLPLPAFYPSHPLLEKDRAFYGSQQSMEYLLKFLTLDWLCTYVSWSSNNSDWFHFTSILMKQKEWQLRDLSANFTMTYSRSLQNHCHKPAVPWEVSLADNLLRLGLFYQTTKTHSSNLSKFKIRWW